MTTTFSSDPSSEADVIISKQDEEWCRHVLRFHPSWIISGAKKHAWIDEKILTRLNERYSWELMDLLQKKDSLFVEKSSTEGGWPDVYDGFYFCSRSDLFSGVKFRHQPDIGKLLWRKSMTASFLPLGIFSQHFLKN